MSAEIQAWFQDYKRKLENKAHKRGRREGIKEGRCGMLLLLLRRKFGELPSQVVERVNSADDAQLELWIERILTAPTLADVFEDAG